MKLDSEGIHYEFYDATEHIHRPKSDTSQFMKWTGIYTNGEIYFRGTHVTALNNICVLTSDGCDHLSDEVSGTTLEEVIELLDGKSPDALKPEDYDAALDELDFIQYMPTKELCPMVQALTHGQFRGRVIRDYSCLILVTEADKLVAELKKVLIVAKQNNVEFIWN